MAKWSIVDDDLALGLNFHGLSHRRAKICPRRYIYGVAVNYAPIINRLLNRREITRDRPLRREKNSSPINLPKTK